LETAVKDKKKIILEYAKSAAIAIALALVIRAFVVQAFKIPSGSMEPTLMVGDHILVNKFIYGVKLPFVNKTIIPFKEPKREDIVVFIFPQDKSKDFIKRVIALPGEKVEIRDNKIYIDDKLYPDPYGHYENSKGTYVFRGKFGPVKVPERHVFVLGDNRDHSYDSRYWGFVPIEYLRGKAMIVYWSWPNWNRILHVIR
jgi:signal peptidase I